MSSDDQSPGPGPEGAEEYMGPGYPTVSDRRSHLKKLALAAGAVTVGGGLFMAGKELVKPSCGTGDGVIGAAKGWLTNLTSDPPPRLAGAPPPPPQDPRIRGDMVVPEHVDPGATTCVKPPVVNPDDHPPLPGEMAMPEHVAPPPEPAPPKDFPRIKGKVAMPVHETYPDAAGGISEPILDEEVLLQPPRNLPTPVVEPVVEPEVTPPLPTGEVEGKFRSLYLTGSTSDGKPFTVLIRVDPEDAASYEACKAARKAILTALSPLVGTPALAQDQAASKLVTRLVPGATVRFAGVVR